MPTVVDRGVIAPIGAERAGHRHARRGSRGGRRPAANHPGRHARHLGARQRGDRRRRLRAARHPRRRAGRGGRRRRRERRGRSRWRARSSSNVQVLTAGTRYDQEEAKDGKPQRSTVVTLAVLPADGERIALASAQGKLSLVLRNPLDVDPADTNGHQAGGADEGHRARAGARRAQAPDGAGQEGRAAGAGAAAHRRFTRSRQSARRSGRKRRSTNMRVIHRFVMRHGDCRGARCLSTVTAAARPGAGGGSRPAPRGADGGTLDGPEHRVRRHPHRGDQPGHRRRDRRAAARDPHRRQGAGHDQPDRVGRHAAGAVRPGGRAADHGARAAAQAAVSGRGDSGCRQRRRHRPVGPRVQHRGDAARGRSGAGRGAQGERHQHDDGARRRRIAAGDAAGALRRGEPARTHGAGRRRSSPAPTASRTGRAARRRSSSRRRSSTETTDWCSPTS